MTLLYSHSLFICQHGLIIYQGKRLLNKIFICQQGLIVYQGKRLLNKISFVMPKGTDSISMKNVTDYDSMSCQNGVIVCHGKMSLIMRAYHTKSD